MGTSLSSLVSSRPALLLLYRARRERPRTGKEDGQDKFTRDMAPVERNSTQGIGLEGEGVPVLALD